MSAAAEPVSSEYGWRGAASCLPSRGANPDDFFYEDNYPAASKASFAAQARAKLICSTCPVRRQCLIFAISNNEPAGIWGGYTADERLQLRRQNR